MGLARNLIFLLFTYCIHLGQCHVSLKYPPARKYQLDFLNTGRVSSPCGGMDKGRPTLLRNDEDLTVVWRMAYAHGGGYRITLLDPELNLVRDLTNGFVNKDKITVEQHTLSLDRGLECLNCTLRLERQSVAHIEDYVFMSCADVSIVRPERYIEDCMGAGRLTRYGSCECYDHRTGPRCQFENECNYDGDCADPGHFETGKCHVNDQLLGSKNRCFCREYLFGESCNRSNFISDSYPEFNRRIFDDFGLWKQRWLISGGFVTLCKRALRYTKAPGLEHAGVEFYYRLLNDGKVVEGVVVGKATDSFVGVGWRPVGLTAACKAFPYDAEFPRDELAAMDCVDFVISMVDSENRTRIRDSYSRDRSSPEPDSFYGGEDDIVDVIGWESRGSTYVVFRKVAVATDETDHSFSGQLHLVVAHGQSGDPFYAKDVLKYHGRNRWRTTIAVGEPPQTAVKELPPAPLGRNRPILFPGLYFQAAPINTLSRYLEILHLPYLL